MKKPLFWLGLILILAAILRFYNLSGYLQFLGDQGRDLLAVKRMIVDHKFTLLGPTASVGGFYTGPVYYYFMLPFLWLFGLNPVGPAVMAALFGVATVALVYFFVKDLAGERAGITAAVLVAVSPKMIEISRFSWNPNPVPFFSLAAIYAVYKRKIFLAGLLTGVLIQLHYINLIFIPIVGLGILLLFPLNKWFKQGLVVVSGFLLGVSLFLIFELRHGFPNTKSVLEFIFRGGATVAPRTNNFFELFVEIYRRTFENVFQIFASPVFNLVIYICLVVFLVWAWKQKSRVFPVLVWLFVGMLGLGFYRGTLYEHYFNFLYILPFIILGVVISRHWILTVALIPLLYFSAVKWFLWSPPNNLLVQTQAVDKIVVELTGNKPFNFALIAPGNSDHAYRYFLEVGDRIPLTILNPVIDPDRKTVTDQLIVVCEQKDCAPLGNPQWEIAGFGRAEIVEQKTGPAGIKILKLIHYKG